MGLDLHKAYVYGYVFQAGQKGTPCRFANTPDHWDRFLATQVTPDTWIAIEATGNAFPGDDRRLERAGHVVVAHPAALKRLGSGRHTDRVDAERLAQMLALGTMPAVWVPPAEVRAIRALITQAAACQQAATAWTNRARSVLIRQGYAVPRSVAVDDWFADHVAELDATTQLLLTSALTMAAEARAEADRLQGEILHRLADRPEMAWLWSLAGLGPWTAAVVWAWIGDPHRFCSARPVTRDAGLDPSVFPSGETDGRGPIRRQGPAALRHALSEAAGFALRSPPRPVRAGYQRLLPRVGKRRAIVAVARTVRIAAWRVWREQRLAREVDPRRYQKKLSAIRVTLRTRPPYPLAERLAAWAEPPHGPERSPRAAASPASA